MLRHDIVEPMSMKSNTDMEEPMRDRWKIEKVEPKRWKLRRDSVEPRGTKSNTDIEEPNLAKRNTANVDPKRA